MRASPAAGAPPLTAFVLSGGGSLGAVQVGQLRALAERDIAPDLLCGASVGSLRIDVAVARGARRIDVLPTGFTCALDRPPRGALAMAVHALGVLVEQRLVQAVRRHQHTVELVVLPPPCPVDVIPIDFSRTDALIERGDALARHRLSRRRVDGQAAMLERRHRRAHRRERGD